MYRSAIIMTRKRGGALLCVHEGWCSGSLKHLYLQARRHKVHHWSWGEFILPGKRGQMVDDLYGICEEDSVQILGEQVEPWELLGVFLEGMLKFLEVPDLVKIQNAW